MTSFFRNVASPGGHGLSREFFELVKAIGEARSKQEEDRIIGQEVALLKAAFNQAGNTSLQIKEYLVRALYVEMLGHDGSFAFIHSIKLASDKHSYCKRLGYVVSCLTLSPDESLTLLLVNTIQRDLKSPCVLDVGSALICVATLLNTEILPAVLPQLLSLANESTSHSIRRRAIATLTKVVVIDPSSLQIIRGFISRWLCDPEPSTVFAAVEFLVVIFSHNKHAAHRHSEVDSFFLEVKENMVPTLVSIVKQLLDHRIPADYQYHRVSYPWLLMRILNLWTLLCKDDQKASEQVYTILAEVVRKTELNIANIASAVVLEAVRTASLIYPDTRLLQMASNSIGRFLKSSNRNLRFVGISILGSLVKAEPSLVAPLRIAVVDSLEDSDDTLKKSTLLLLSNMANTQNAETITEKLITYAEECVDATTRKEILARVMSVVDVYAPSYSFYCDTLLSCCEKFGNEVPEESVRAFLSVVSGHGEQGAAPDVRLENQTYTVNAVVKMADRFCKMNSVAMKICGWILGEYGHLVSVKGYDEENDILDLLKQEIERSDHFGDPQVPICLYTAYFKLMSRKYKHNKEEMEKFWLEVLNNREYVGPFMEVDQRISEFKLIFDSKEISDQKQLPNLFDVSYDVIKLRFNIQFFEKVLQKLKKSGYLAKSPRRSSVTAVRTTPLQLPPHQSRKTPKPLKLDPYQQNTVIYSNRTDTVPEHRSQTSSVAGQQRSGVTSQGNYPAENHREPQIKRKMESKWGPEGYIIRSTPEIVRQGPPPSSTNPRYDSQRKTISMRLAPREVAEDNTAVESEAKLKVADALFQGLPLGDRKPAIPERRTSKMSDEDKHQPPVLPAQLPASGRRTVSANVDLLEQGEAESTSSSHNENLIFGQENEYGFLSSFSRLQMSLKEAEDAWSKLSCQYSGSVVLGNRASLADLLQLLEMVFFCIHSTETEAMVSACLNPSNLSMLVYIRMDGINHVDLKLRSSASSKQCESTFKAMKQLILTVYGSATDEVS